MYDSSSESLTDEDSWSESESPEKKKNISQHLKKRVKQSHIRPPKHITVLSNTVSTYTEDKHLHISMKNDISMCRSEELKNSIIASRADKTIRDNLKEYLRQSWYKYTKFYTDQKKPVVHLKAAIKEGHITIPAEMGLTFHEFIQMYASKIGTALAELRQNSIQTIKNRHKSKCVLQCSMNNIISTI